jgi:hypothetical protein
MMAKKPDDRFQTAEEVVAALEGGAMPIADLATMPTRAIEPQKAPLKGKAAGPPPAIAAAATTPLPRASASMGVPRDIAAARAASAAAAPPAAKPALKPKETGKKKSSGLLAAVIILALAGAGLGGYLLFMRPGPPAQVAVVTPPPAPVIHDSAAAADSAKAAAAAAPAPEPSKTETSKRDRTKRPRPDETKKAAPAPAPAARPTGTGTISIHGQPRNATVLVDGVRKSGDRIKVQAGVPLQIEVQAQGFQPLNQSVTVANNQTLSFDATMHAAGAAPGGTASPPPGVDCSGPNTFIPNPNRICFDDRPVAQTRTEVAAPASCARSIRDANILVHVSEAGEVIDPAPVVTRPSGCAAFDELAKAFILDIAFRPARKNGQAVVGWAVVPMRPTH